MKLTQWEEESVGTTQKTPPDSNTATTSDSLYYFILFINIVAGLLLVAIATLCFVRMRRKRAERENSVIVKMANGVQQHEQQQKQKLPQQKQQTHPPQQQQQQPQIKHSQPVKREEHQSLKQKQIQQQQQQQQKEQPNHIQKQQPLKNSKKKPPAPKKSQDIKPVIISPTTLPTAPPIKETEYAELGPGGRKGSRPATGIEQSMYAQVNVEAEAAFYPPPGNVTDTKVIVGNGDIVYDYSLLRHSIPDESDQNQGDVNGAVAAAADPIYDMAG